MVEALHRMGAAPVCVNPQLIGGHSISISTEAGRLAVRLRVGDSEIRIAPATRVLLRRPKLPRPSDFAATAEVAEFSAMQYRAAWLALFSAPAVWMNDLTSSRRLETDKMRQQIIAGRVGLRTIPTLCTDDVDEFASFVASTESEFVSVKSMRSWHTEVLDDARSFGTFTRRLDRAEALRLGSQVAHAPVIVQPYIPKAFELRVTVVGDAITACRIDSQASALSMVDWRHYDIENVRHDLVELAPEVEAQLLAFMKLSHLLFGAIDLIVSPGGDIHFVEINPSGQYGWIESLTGADISGDIARWLLAQS